LERANAYWKAGEIRDLATVYAIEAGSLTGALSPEIVRRSLERSRLLGYELGAIQIDGNHALIEVQTEYSVQGLRSVVPMTRRDHWVFTEGDWYHGATKGSPFLKAPGGETGAAPSGKAPPPSTDES